MVNNNLKQEPTVSGASMITFGNHVNNPELKGKKIICIGLPNTGYFNWQTVPCLLSMLIPAGYCLNFNIMANCLVYDARERLAEYAIDIGATHLLFIDSDMTPPNHVILSMHSKNVDIISGKIFQRKYPYQPCFYTKARITKDMKPIMEGPLDPDNWPTEGAHLMEGVGMACTMIKTEIFKYLPKPWFFPYPGVGEDLAFCIKAREKGFKIYTDFGVDCGHIGEYVCTTDSFKIAYKEWMKDPKNKDKLIFGEENDNVANQNNCWNAGKK